MKLWNTPNLVELDTKLTANGGKGYGQDLYIEEEDPDPVTGNVTVHTTFSTFDDISWIFGEVHGTSLLFVKENTGSPVVPKSLMIIVLFLL